MDLGGMDTLERMISYDSYEALLEIFHLWPESKDAIKRHPKYIISVVKNDSSKFMVVLLKNEVKMKIKLTSEWVNVQQHFL